MPGFSAGMANVSRDEQRHIGFGVKVLSELLAEGSPGWEENRAAVTELLREVLPYGPAVFSPPNLDREYTECYGFTLEDIFAFGLKLIRQRWRTIGYPTEEMPPGVFPFDPEAQPEEVAKRQVKLMEAGILGPPDGRTPGSLAGDAAPLLRRGQAGRQPGGRQRLAARLPVALHRRRPLAPGDRQRLDPGRAGRGAQPDPDARGKLGRLRRAWASRTPTR